MGHEKDGRMMSSAENITIRKQNCQKVVVQDAMSVHAACSQQTRVDLPTDLLTVQKSSI